MKPVDMGVCEARVWRGSMWPPRSEMCGKPAKGTRIMRNGGDKQRPACGFHIRSQVDALVLGE